MIVANTEAKTVAYDLSLAVYAEKHSSVPHLRVPAHLFLASFMSGVHAVKSLAYSFSSISTMGHHLWEFLKATYNFAILLIFSVIAIVAPSKALIPITDVEMRTGHLFSQNFQSLRTVMDGRGNIPMEEVWYYFDVDTICPVKELPGASFCDQTGTPIIPQHLIRRGITIVKKINTKQTREAFRDMVATNIRYSLIEKNSSVTLSQRKNGEVKGHEVHDALLTDLTVKEGDLHNITLLMTSLLTDEKSPDLKVQRHTVHALPTTCEGASLCDPSQTMGEPRVESRSSVDDFTVSKVVTLSGEIYREVSFGSTKYLKVS